MCSVFFLFPLDKCTFPPSHLVDTDSQKRCLLVSEETSTHCWKTPVGPKRRVRNTLAPPLLLIIFCQYHPWAKWPRIHWGHSFTAGGVWSSGRMVLHQFPCQYLQLSVSVWIYALLRVSQLKNQKFIWRLF